MKRIIFFYIIPFLSIIAFSKCAGPEKTKFSKDELQWINVYNVGDTLVFKSGNGEFDSSFIIKKEIYYPEYNPIELHGKYLPQHAVVWYKNKNLEYNPDGDRLVDMVKDHPQNETSLIIDYRYSSIIVLNLYDTDIKKFNQGKIYEFDTYDKRARPEEPKKILWHADYGVIQYVTHANVVWKRINYLK